MVFVGFHNDGFYEAMPWAVFSIERQHNDAVICLPRPTCKSEGIEPEPPLS